MSTNGMTSWAVDLKTVGAIYPFQGAEVLMVVIGLVFWVGWHIYQIRQENAEIESEINADKRGDKAKDLIGKY